MTPLSNIVCAVTWPLVQHAGDIIAVIVVVSSVPHVVADGQRYRHLESSVRYESVERVRPCCGVDFGRGGEKEGERFDFSISSFIWREGARWMERWEVRRR